MTTQETNIVVGHLTDNPTNSVANDSPSTTSSSSLISQTDDEPSTNGIELKVVSAPRMCNGIETSSGRHVLQPLTIDMTTTDGNSSAAPSVESLNQDVPFTGFVVAVHRKMVSFVMVECLMLFGTLVLKFRLDKLS